jgi:cob(I)alamin adenosyltransferase
MLLVFTGNGKGKTTASLGQAVRAVGQGKRVLMIQFIKGPWKSGEDFAEIKSKKNQTGEFKLEKMGLGFVGILGDNLPRSEHEKAARKALAYFRQELVKNPAAGGWDMIILDEINVAVSLGLVGEKEVLESVKDLPPERMVIFTGRGAPQSFLERADLVSEVNEIKHPFQQGEAAKSGLEF